MQDQAWCSMKNGGAITADVGAPSDYERRKELEVCTYPRCPNRPDERPGMESNECEQHHDASIARKRKHRRRRKRTRRHEKRARREEQKKWRLKKLCKQCGAKPLRGEKYCALCMVATGRAPAVIADNSRDKAARIAANTRIDKTGRSRHHGQGKRGRQSVGAIDAKDIDYAEDALRKMRAGLVFASNPELSRLEKHDAVNAANSLGDLVIRFVEDVQSRHGHFGTVDPRTSTARR